MNLGLSLSGGGIKGAAHIGVLKAFEEEKIKINYISGTSSGSIVAALYAIGYKPDEIIEIFKKYGKKVRYFDYKNIIKLILGIIIKREIVIKGLTEGKAIEKLLREKCLQKGKISINDANIPLLIPAVNVNNGEIYFFSSKLTRNAFSDKIQYISNVSIPSAVRASCSYPGVFSPFKINEKECVDGGIRENIPWKGLKVIGAERVVTVTFEKEIKKKRNINIIDVIESSISIMGQELANYELEGVDNIIKIKTGNVGLLQTEKIDEVYISGYNQAKEQVRDIRQKYCTSKDTTNNYHTNNQ